VNILIVKLSAIGDVIHTLPALNAIRARYPDAHITWVVEEAAAGLIRGHRALDRVLVSKRKAWIKSLCGTSRHLAMKEIRGFIRELRGTRYDMVLDFQALLKSGMIVALARGGRKIGFDRGMEHMEHSYLFLNERIAPVDMNIHALTRNLMMLERIGIHSDRVVYDLPIQAEDRQTVARLTAGTASEGPLVAVNPMTRWDTKLWLNDRFADLADRLVDGCRARVVFTGSAEDHAVVEHIRAMMTQPSVNLAGQTTLMTLAALYEKADVVVTTDTGPMHLAAAVGTPVVALFGPTAPWRTGPFGPQHRVIRADLACSPCFKRHCDTTACMEHIRVDQVMEAVQDIMSRNSG